MEADPTLSHWLFRPEAWVIAGLVLIIADILVGFGLIVLPFGVAALLLAALLYGHSQQLFGGADPFSSWRAVLIWFAGLSIVSVGLIRVVFQRSKKNGSDINRY